MGRASAAALLACVIASNLQRSPYQLNYPSNAHRQAIHSKWVWEQESRSSEEMWGESLVWQGKEAVRGDGIRSGTAKAEAAMAMLVDSHPGLKWSLNHLLATAQLFAPLTWR
jgi:hypothetical protein